MQILYNFFKGRKIDKFVRLFSYESIVSNKNINSMLREVAIKKYLLEQYFQLRVDTEAKHLGLKKSILKCFKQKG